MSSNGKQKPAFELRLKIFVHGQWVESSRVKHLTLTSAVDDSIITEKLICASADDVDRAVESCEKALEVWQSLALTERRRILLKFADLLVENAERLSYLDTVVTGKPISMGHFEVNDMAESFRYYAGFIDKLHGDLALSEDGFLRGVIQQPLGVCAAIVPFNSPLITLGMKVAPALAAGNTMVLKTSEYNPLSVLALGELAIQAGLPPGALNVMCGDAEAGQALSSHMKIRKISFTGSPVVGRMIQAAAAASNLKRVTLELGGKSPVLVFNDTNVESAAAGCMQFMAFNGQGCVNGTRVLVQEDIADAFVEALVPMVQGMGQTLGSDPFDPTTMSMPMFHQIQQDRVVAMLEDGKQESTVLAGGSKWGTKGLYIEPTVLYKPASNARVVREEIFGPVLVVQTFETEAQALKMANDTEYGLGAYVYTSSMDRAIRVSKALEAGTVCVNTGNVVHKTIPFGGWKGSGIGAENGEYALRAYTQPKSIVIKFSQDA